MLLLTITGTSINEKGTLCRADLLLAAHEWQVNGSFRTRGRRAGSSGQRGNAPSSREGAGGERRGEGAPAAPEAGKGEEQLPRLEPGPSFAYFHLCAFLSHVQGSSGVVATIPFVWHGRTKSPTSRAGPCPELALRPE